MHLFVCIHVRVCVLCVFSVVLHQSALSKEAEGKSEHILNLNERTTPLNDCIHPCSKFYNKLLHAILQGSYFNLPFLKRAGKMIALLIIPTSLAFCFVVFFSPTAQGKNTLLNQKLAAAAAAAAPLKSSRCTASTLGVWYILVGTFRQIVTSV